MQKTLGGDRLGAGKKMKVELHNYERSSHNQGYIWRSTMSAGTLVPFLVEIGLPGTTFDINLDCDMKTQPTEGPLFGSYKVQLDTFLVPIRLYNAQLHNNELGIGKNMSAVKLPQIEYTALGKTLAQLENIDTSQVNPSSLPAYLGMRGIGYLDTGEAETKERQFNAIPTLAYWEIYKNYYANKQEEIGAVIHNDNVVLDTTQVVSITTYSATGTAAIVNKVPPGALQSIPMQIGSSITVVSLTAAEPEWDRIYLLTNGNAILLSEIGTGWAATAGVNTWVSFVKDKYIPSIVTGWNYQQQLNPSQVSPVVTTFNLSNIDDMRKKVLQEPTPQFIVNDANIIPYTYLYEQPNGVPNILSSQEGLALKTYQSDLFNNWLKTENIEAISVATAVDTSGGSFTMDQLIISKKVWNMLNRINVSGGSYDDWLDAVYVHEKYKTSESPMYMGGLIKELVFQEVVSNAATEEQPLGQLAGRGVLGKKHKGGNVVIHIDELSYVIGIISLTPRIDYSQGNMWHTQLKSMDDFHKPALDQIGFQELITEQMAWWDTFYNEGSLTWITKSAGKQPAWLNYMTNVNRCYGNFAIPDNEMFMTLNRRYEPETSLATPSIADLTTYIDPSKFNFIFAETQLDAQNFWAQIAVDMTVRRKMSGKLMPNL